MSSTSSAGQNFIATYGAFGARALADDLSWGVGAIQPQSTYAGNDAQIALVTAVLRCLEPVADVEQVYSACTDGRLPVRLLSDEPVPVREQMVGADIVSAFYVAETLGSRFYKNPQAPVAERVREVAEFLHASRLQPSSHVGCGAAAGFVAVTENAVRFGGDPRFVARLKALLPAQIYDAAHYGAMRKNAEERLNQNRYKGLSAQTFLDAVQAVSGTRAIAELRDDGRGVHGHVEEQIIRLQVPGVALNTAKLAKMTNGREVFAVNDLRMDRLARVFARGNNEDYATARLALEEFASAGHGTLAKNLPTYILSTAQ